MKNLILDEINKIKSGLDTNIILIIDFYWTDCYFKNLFKCKL